MSVVCDELRRQARRYLRRERPDHTLQSTALVNEAYLRLVDQRSANWRNRSQFFGIAAQLMRRILVDHARERSAAKRGSGAPKLALVEELAGAAAPDVDLVALDDALKSLPQNISFEAARCLSKRLHAFRTRQLRLRASGDVL